MQNVRFIKAFTCAIALLAAVAFQNAHAQTDPPGGKPVPGSKPSVADLDYQVKYQRAFEAGIWSMPAIGIIQINETT
jgi:hypothetical protein